MSDQRCGTCRWWERSDGYEYENNGECKHRLPHCVVLVSIVKATDGTDCPCYERKERDEREGTD